MAMNLIYNTFSPALAYLFIYFHLILLVRQGMNYDLRQVSMILKVQIQESYLLHMNDLLAI